MRKTFLLSPLPLVSLLTGLLGGLDHAAQAAMLSDWKYHPENAALEFQTGANVTPRYFLLANPMRIVVDLPDTQLQGAPADAAVAGNIRRIRVSEFEPGTTRLVLELAPNSVLQTGQVALEDLGNGHWKIRPLIAEGGFAGDAMVDAVPGADTGADAAADAAADEMQGAVELPVIAVGEAVEDAAMGEFQGIATLPSDNLLQAGQDLTVTQELLPPPRPTASAIAPLPTPQVTVPLLESQAPSAANFTTLLNSFEPLPAAEPSLGRPPQAAILQLPTLAIGEPEVPYLVEFGQPLPGITAEFPAAYRPRSRP